MYLTDTATGTKYCKVVGRSLNTPVNTSLCPSNSPLGTGDYSVVVYTIESDGSVSSVPAITGVVVDIFEPSMSTCMLMCVCMCICVCVWVIRGVCVCTDV